MLQKRVDEQHLVRTQVSRKLEAAREVSHLLSGIHSWSRYIRNTLGMSLENQKVTTDFRERLVNLIEEKME